MRAFSGKRAAFFIFFFLLISCTVLFTSCGEEHNHSWSDWETYIEPGCKMAGQEKSVCSCGEVRYRSVTREHDFGEAVTDIEKMASVRTCALCGEKAEEPLTYRELGVPVLSLSGSSEEVFKDSRVSFNASYESEYVSFSAVASVKIQGAVSASYPKKNYSVKFLDGSGNKMKVAFCDEWGAHSKYCLKANYSDYSQLRNVVSAKLYGQLVKSLGKTDTLSTLTNGGAIDGFPVVVYMNGEFLGLYTLNTPKDEWVFSMNDKSAKQALLMATGWTQATELKEHISDDFVSSGFDLEYCSTDTESGEGSAWVAESFNAMVDFVNSTDGAAFRNGIGQYIDVDRAIDYMIFTWVAGAYDNTAMNIIWATYDGTLWIPSAYDLDATWGLSWDGEEYTDPGVVNPGINKTVLFEKLNENFAPEILARYVALRQSVFSVDNIYSAFEQFDSMIPESIRSAETKLWTDVPGQKTNNIDQIKNYAYANLVFLDSYLGLN